MATEQGNATANELPLVSVPLCTFNGALYLREQLDSVLGQTYSNIEVIAVDDCSTDDTLLILQSYAARDVRVRVASNPHNLGFRDNFARALSMCRGDYIAPCDQDDVWEPDKISTLLAHVGNAAMVYCDSMLVDAQGKPLGRCMSDKWHMPAINDPAVFALENNISGHAMLFRGNILKRALPIPESFFHDWWLAAVAASMGGIVSCREVLVRYRQHERNVTRYLDARDRPAGFGLQTWQIISGRVAQLAHLSGVDRAMLNDFLLLLTRRETQWVSLGLFWFLVRQQRIFFALRRRSSVRRILMTFSYAAGLRVKRLFNAHKYGPVLKPTKSVHVRDQ